MQELHIRDSVALAKKIDEMKRAGAEKLHVVSDFDRTLTKCFIDGKKMPSVFALIREGGYLRADYKQKALALFDEYHPIEIDDTLEPTYKFQKMQEWWEKCEQLMISCGMHKDIINKVVNKYPSVFKDGALALFDTLHKKHIPLLIFSAGIGNVIEAYVKKENKLTKNVKIVANQFIFNEEGYATGYTDNIIHTMNKSEQVLDEQYKKEIQQRDHVILLGDCLGDLGMANDLEKNHVITIGFLNEYNKEKLEIYKQHFDVVITNESMAYVNNLIKDLVHA